jgi:hypothetical protein
MNNINYPTWESGIPELLPEITPYNEDYKWVLFLESEKFQLNNIDYLLLEYNSIQYEIIRNAWSYMEILKWLREKDIHITIQYITESRYQYNPTIDDNRTAIKYVFTDDKFHRVKWTTCFEYERFTSFEDCITYHEALDEAILHCLKLIKKNE